MRLHQFTRRASAPRGTADASDSGRGNCAGFDRDRRPVRRRGAARSRDIGHDQFGRGARRRRAQIGDEIRDREIDFVADRAHDRNRRMENGAGHDLFVELPQVFDAAAAARHDHEIERLPGLVRLGQFANRDRDFGGGADALHAHRIDQNLASPGARRRSTLSMSRMAAPLGEVTMPMRFGNFGSGRLRAESKSPSASSLRLSASNFACNKPSSARLQDLHAELILPARFEDGDVAVNLHLRAVGQRLARMAAACCEKSRRRSPRADP